MAKMIRKIIGICMAVCMLAGCSNRADNLSADSQSGSNSDLQIDDESEDARQTLTIMHVDYNKPETVEYYKHVGDDLGINIELIAPPSNPDTRQAKISTLLASGDSSVDIFTINDEMISEFKYKGYTEPLNDILSQEEQNAFPQEYFLKVIMKDGNIYSLPFRMDILALWVNEEWLNEAGISDLSDKDSLKAFLEYPFNDNRLAYGGAWEKTHVYNEIGEFINLFGGNYYDWKNPYTLEAVEFMKGLVLKGSTDLGLLLDQYEQMNQKFINDRYGMLFSFSCSINTYIEAGVYGEDHIHMANIPDGFNCSTYVATWQYALNHASTKKDIAKTFLKYISSKDECIRYAELTNTFPARMDIFRYEDLNILGYDEMKEYVLGAVLCPRPIPQNSLVYIEQLGDLFQKYLLDELTLEEYAKAMQQLIDENFDVQ